jgi:hypothetical protein
LSVQSGRRCEGVRRLPCSAQEEALVRLFQAAIRGPKAVLAYLSRYTHRVAISNSRLIKADITSVTFKVKNYRVEGRGRYTAMTLDTSEFIRRFLIHVLPKGSIASAITGSSLAAPRPRHRHGAQASGHACARHLGRRRQRGPRRGRHAEPAVPLLLRPHAHHRGV